MSGLWQPDNGADPSFLLGLSAFPSERAGWFSLAACHRAFTVPCSLMAALRLLVPAIAFGIRMKIIPDGRNYPGIFRFAIFSAGIFRENKSNLFPDPDSSFLTTHFLGRIMQPVA
jgi:hypothetical protein